MSNNIYKKPLIDVAASIVSELPFSLHTDDDDINEYFALPHQMSQGLDYDSDDSDTFKSPPKNKLLE